MSEEEQKIEVDPGLRQLIGEWTENNRARTNKWIAELFASDINSLKALKDQAQGSKWQNTLDDLSHGLVTQLQKWKDQTFPTSSTTLGKRDHTNDMMTDSKRANQEIFIYCTLTVHKTDSLVRYQKISESLKDTKEIDIVLNRIADVKRYKGRDVPFLFLEGSSGMGKTQTVLAVREKLLQDKRIVHYFLAESSGTETQAIYEAFREITSAFHQCVKRDLTKVEHIRCSDLRTKRLYTYGFAKSLIENALDSEKIEFYISPCYSSDVLQIVTDKRKPVIIIDEFIVGLSSQRETRDQRIRKASFIRNVFRSLEFVVLTTGTDSRVANFIEMTAASREPGDDENAIPWCYIIGEHAPVNLNALGLPPPVISQKLEYILQKSRPLFTSLAIQYIKEYPGNDFLSDNKLVDIIDGIGGFVAKEATKRKGIFRDYYGCLGQLCMFQNISYYSIYGEHDYSPSDFINYHFANLYEPNKSFTLNINGCRDQEPEKYKKWYPISHFPSPSDDILLHLSLTGGKNFWPFQDKSSSKCSFLKFHSELMNISPLAKRRIRHENNLQPSNDGQFLEDVAAICVSASSHVGGISGVGVDNFLKELCFHIFGAEVDMTKYFDKMFTPLKGLVVPYLSVSNQKWPLALTTVPGSRFGNLSRLRKPEILDIGMEVCSPATDDCVLSVECKDRSRAIDLETMENIIWRIPSSSSLHLVFTRDLQDAYYAKTARDYNTVFSGRVRNDVYLKLTQVEKEILITSISGFPSTENTTSPTGVVLFVVCPPELRYDVS